MLYQIDIASIEVFDSGHTAFYTTRGRWACSCGVMEWRTEWDYIHEFWAWLESQPT